MRKLFFFILLFLPLSFSQAENTMDEEAISYREQGYKLQSRGDLRGALGYYQKAIVMNPHFAAAYNDIGVIYESMGDLDSAIAMYLKVVEIDPEYLASYSNLGFLYEKKGNRAKALEYWKKRANLGNPNDYWTQKARQRLWRYGLDPDKEKHQEQHKKDIAAKVHFKLGFDSFGKGRFRKAEEEFNKVINLNPSNEDLLQNAVKYHKIAKELAKDKKRR